MMIRFRAWGLGLGLRLRVWGLGSFFQSVVALSPAMRGSESRLEQAYTHGGAISGLGFRVWGWGLGFGVCGG